MRITEIGQSRRFVIVSAGIGVLATVVAACSGDRKPAAEATDSTSAASGGAPGAVLAKTADVPVGSGVIVDDVVVTQPTTGVFKGLSSVCTHAGCHVSEVKDGKIVCPCHGSQFNLDGSVAQGPAKKPLETKAVTVQGDSVVAS